MSEPMDELLDILGREDVKAAMAYRSKWVIDGQLPVTAKDYLALRAWLDKQTFLETDKTRPVPNPLLGSWAIVVLAEGQRLVGSERTAINLGGRIFTMPNEIEPPPPSRRPFFHFPIL